jgi:hypothetical protein
MNDDARDALATVAALHTARETGVLDALLTDADTPTDVAAQTEVDERTASVLVDVLADRGFFDAVGDAYEPTNRALGLLTKTDLRSIGRTPHELDLFECYTTLPAVATETDAATAARPDDYDRNHLGALQATPDATVSAAVSAAIRATPHADRVLDLGGAPGAHATEFAARGTHVTLRDTPDRIDAARPLLAARDVTLDPGPLTSDLPNAGLVFAVDLTPRLDDPALADAFTAAHDALAGADTPTDESPDDRTLVLLEHIRGRSPRTPTHRLDALATGHPGDHRTEHTLRETLHEAGFDPVDVNAVPGLDAHAVVATPRRTTGPRRT